MQPPQLLAVYHAGQPSFLPTAKLIPTSEPPITWGVLVTRSWQAGSFATSWVMLFLAFTVHHITLFSL